MGFDDEDAGFLKTPSGGGSSGCYPRLFIDDLLVFPGGGVPTPPDEVVDPNEIAGVEVYRSGGEAPTKYMETGSACGVILIWTRGGWG